MSDIKKEFKALTPEQRAVIEQERVEGARTPDEWLAMLGPVAEFDTAGDKMREQHTGGFFARRFARKHDVPDGLRLFVMPLLPILREDQDPAAALELRVDLTGPTEPSKKTGEGAPYSKGAYFKCVDSFYEDPWIEGHAQFVDGADIRFKVTDRVRSTTRTKHSASGKTKHKYGSKKQTELAVEVSFPAKNYGAGEQVKSPPAGEGKTKQAVKPGDGRTVVKLTRVVKPENAAVVPDVGLLLELIANAYEQVNPSRQKKL